MHDDLRPLQGLIQTYVLQEQTDAALEILSGELKRNPRPQLKLLLGDTAATAGKYDLAIEQYSQVLATNPNSIDVNFRLGQAYKAKGDPHAAIRYYQTAASLNPKDGRAWAFLASAQQDGGLMEEAKANYKRALDLYPKHSVLMNNLAYLIADTGGNLDDALKYSQESLHLQPGNANFADTVGLVMLKQENTETALQIFGGLAKKFPENPSFRYHLAMAFLKKGDRERAKSELNATRSLKRSKDEDRRIEELMRSLG
jgi:tetratricopeptide (TPR) repeat protein